MTSQGSKAESLEATFEGGEPLRLDAFLARVTPGLSREYLKSLIQEGYVTVNGQPASRPSRRLRGGERVVLERPALVEALPEAEDLPLDILYEDGELLVVNKARGMLTHPLGRRMTGTLVNALLHHCTDLGGIHGVLRPGIVHRLDRDTSGVMVVAKNDQAQVALSDQFRERSVRKYYWAVVHGQVTPSRGIVAAPLSRDPRHRTRMRVDERGREARTTYRVLRRFEAHSLLLLQLHTGRTHQIRVHLSHLGHPLVGDPLYGGRRGGGPPFDGVALHSGRLSFDHPGTGKRLTLHAPVPADMRRLLIELHGRG